MNFPDFLEFKPFNDLRTQIGATELGHFEFFDPRKHISADEKQQLLVGLEISLTQVTKLVDNTLAYKNARVLISLMEPACADDWLYHPGGCEQLFRLQGKLRATMVAPNHDNGTYRVCGRCLQSLHYKGFNAVRNRHRHYSQQLYDNFDLDEFFKRYPSYPLTVDKLNQDVVI